MEKCKSKSDMSFAQAVKHVSQEVDICRKLIESAGDKYVDAVMSLRRLSSDEINTEERSLVFNSFLEQNLPLKVASFSNIDLVWVSNGGQLLLKVIDRNRAVIATRSVISGLKLHYCVSNQLVGDVYVGFHKSAVVVEVMRGGTRLHFQIYDTEEIEALQPFEIDGYGFFIMIAFVLNAHSRNKEQAPILSTNSIEE